ncbi:hypothetical protein SDC9_136113 [bioreactor metagenome]|uniref:Uncharacterized protein n=1 Tax=bioreactor metagenome TaxID=1076179 RepID=A0A645DIF0_9ZZZZ
MYVTLVQSGVGTQTIEVFLAFYIINPNAFTFFDHDIKRMIIVCTIAFFDFDVFLSFHISP